MKASGLLDAHSLLMVLHEILEQYFERLSASHLRLRRCVCL